MKLSFLSFLIILFQNILLLKKFLACDGCFGLFTKIIKRSGTSFCCIFSAWFFHKNVLCLILHLWTKFQCHTFFPSQDIKQIVLLSSYLNSSWYHRLWDLTWSSSKLVADREKMKENGNTKIWISRERNELLRWNKKHFS